MSASRRSPRVRVERPAGEPGGLEICSTLVASIPWRAGYFHRGLEEALARRLPLRSVVSDMPTLLASDTGLYAAGGSLQKVDWKLCKGRLGSMQKVD